jgi:hypothetical protein
VDEFEARIERLEYAEPGVFNLTIVVSPIPRNAPGRGKPVYYSMVLDSGKRSMTPKGLLQKAFDVHHQYEYSDDLNPTLRRQWRTACLADHIVNSLFQSAALRRLRLKDTAKS